MSKKIYFCGSISGGRQDVDLYARIITQLKAYGPVLTEHVGKKDVFTLEEKNSAKEIHDRDVAWLEECDVVVAEVTQPSHGVGYEVGRAVALKKPVLLLYRPDVGKRVSCMMKGAEDDRNVIYKEYVEAQVPEILKEFFG
ncbi:putative 2'-deoxynucleoside 5'-phosphate N-hydrolase 1 [Haliotis rubra]|uniref:putative 2'-deoxynucleoside 5'-phosphate N-hydrolase 1 n=1 Tax=Haliotis rubra TaxID=36100 RepID=UPI001EE5CA38|nr:putative 2'-deoxynucleoside 5'-phosphate N-hydrolase 1 [Haliotis rubra]